MGNKHVGVRINRCTHLAIIEFVVVNRRKMVTVETEHGLQDRSFLQINTESYSPVQAHSSVVIEEIVEPAIPPVAARKRKAKAPISVAAVRRSGRIEKLKGDFKDGKSSAGASTTSFSAAIIDSAAPPPPHLPKDTLQALGTGPCQMHPGDVSDESLDYDSTNDSIE
jgi:hypothetical protein